MMNLKLHLEGLVSRIRAGEAIIEEDLREAIKHWHAGVAEAPVPAAAPAGPAPTMRAKVVVSDVKKIDAENVAIALRGVAKNEPYGADGLDENNTYARFSPQADMHFVIANPALLDTFEVGDTFYAVFTDAPK